MKATPFLLLACLAAASATTGCLRFKPAQDGARHFVLEPIPVPAGSETASSDLPTVGLDRVDLPAYLENPWMAVRIDDAEIAYLQDLQWAEPLDQGLLRVLALNLSRTLHPSTILTAPWRRDSVQRELHVQVLRFEPDASGRVTLQARWRITTPDGTTPPRTAVGEFGMEGPRPDEQPSGAVRTMNRLLGRLSERLAEELRSLPPVESASP